MRTFLICFLIAAAGYLLGSFSTGLTLSHAAKGPNLRKVGSGNTGATNVTRAMGIRDGLITLFGDALKAILACLIGQWMFGHTGALIGGLFAVIGHNWPVLYDFKGGKGAASTCGAMLFCYPELAVICFVVGILTILITKYVSVASMVVILLYTILIAVLHWGSWLDIAWALLLTVLLVIRHRENIQRLLNGTERKFTGKKSKE